MTTALLLGVAAEVPAGTERAKVKVDAVRTGLAAGGGVGAAAGLMLAFRRQRHQEVTAALADRDATERRITELYNAAAEQLGSDKAPVRLTALYTLERLANDNSSHRQTIVNIICAYLRMPYTPVLDSVGRSNEQRRPDRRLPAIGRYRTESEVSPGEHAAAEEREVRLAAQRILRTHLDPNAEVYWDRLALDLVGATLIAFSLRDCTLTSANFTRATFLGSADFTKAVFNGFADFTRATFTDRAFFGDCIISTDGHFEEATFADGAHFGGTSFRSASFGGATFDGSVSFIGATFEDGAWFRTVGRPGTSYFIGETLVGGTGYRGTEFNGDAFFGRAVFSAAAHFRGATFGGIVDFKEARFDHLPELTDARLTDVGRNHILPAGWRIERGRRTSGRLVADTRQSS